MAAQFPPGLIPANNLKDTSSTPQSAVNLLTDPQRAPTPNDDSTAGFLDPTMLSWICPFNPGSGYTTATVAITAPPAGGIQATATTVIASGTIIAYHITNPGKGYTGLPSVVITGDGINGVAYAQISPGDLWVQTSPTTKVFQLTDATPGAAAWLPYYGAIKTPADAGPASIGLYGTLKLKSSYVTNKVLDVTRASDNTTLTLGFSGDEVDGASGDAFCAGTTGRVTKWYDQSGNGNDLSNIAANAPYWTSNTFNGHRSVTFNSVASAAQITVAVPSNGGTGYTSADISKVVTVVGGSGSAGSVIIAAVSGGAVTAVTISIKGAYTTLPPSPASVTGGGTAGTGLTLNLTFSTYYLTGTTGAYGDCTVIAATFPRSASATNVLAVLGSTRVLYLTGFNTSMMVALDPCGMPLSTTPEVSVFLNSPSVVSVGNGNRLARMVLPANPSGTGLTIGYSITAVQTMADFDCAAFMLFPSVLTTAQITAVRASLSARLGISPQVQTRSIWVADGDSITNGYNGSPSLLRNYPRQALDYLNLPLRQHNIGIFGITLAAQLSTIAQRYANLYVPGARNFVVSVLLGTNDIPTGVTGQALYAELQSYVAYLKSLGANVRVVVGTLLPRVSLTTPQQTALTTYNTLIQSAWNLAQSAGGLGADALADFAADPVMGAPGAAANPNLYFDGLHPTDVGYAYMGRITGPAVNSVLR